MQKRLVPSLLALVAACALAFAPARASAQPILTDRDRDIQDAYEVMQAVTMGLLGATALGGTVLLYNMPTSLGEGACARGEGVFGEYGCDGRYSLLHGILAIASIGSYTATAALALAAPDLDQGDEDTVTDVLGVVHGVGIGLTGALGLLAAYPGVIGLSGQSARDFSEALRVVHWLTAVVTTAAFATHMAVDYVD